MASCQPGRTPARARSKAAAQSASTVSAERERRWRAKARPGSSLAAGAGDPASARCASARLSRCAMKRQNASGWFAARQARAIASPSSRLRSASAWGDGPGAAGRAASPRAVAMGDQSAATAWRGWGCRLAAQAVFAAIAPLRRPERPSPRISSCLGRSIYQFTWPLAADLLKTVLLDASCLLLLSLTHINEPF
jgi:hypothetical protein